MSGGFKSDIPPAINRTAKNYIRGMQKGRIRWDKLYGTRAKEVMHKTANKMAMGEMQKMPPTYNEIFGEANKSGDSSLRDWFSKSRSSDGTPGWVQLGGKYAGKPCAKQPGQTTKPKCGSSKMAAALNSDEEEKAFRRKNRQDPNPDRRGRAKNVATEETIREAGDYWHPDPDKDRQISGQGNKARAREDRVSRSSSSSKPDPKKLRPGESYMDYAKRQGKKSTPAPKPKERKRDRIGKAIGRVVDKVAGIKSEARNPYAIGMAKAQELTGDTPPLEKSTIKKAHKIAKAIKKEEKDHEVSMAQSQLSSVEKDVKALKKKLGKKEKNLPAWMQAKITDTEHNMDAAAGYATKEEFELEEGRATDVAIKAIRATQGENPKELSKRTEMIRHLKQRQLKKYLKQRDDKKKIGEELEWLTEEQFDEAAGEKDACYKKVKARYKVWPSAYASGALVKCRKVGAANWGNKSESFQQVQEKCWQGYKKVGMKKKGDKMVPNCVPEEVQNEGASWTKKAGKNSEGGLNEKGRKSYERENPGSDLKAPSKKVGNPRRASFCARMKGMRKRQKPSNNTGDDRLSKSLRAWNC
ncbi:hypothetical protein BJD43_gp140 [Cyanophage S-RIM50]|uniref:DUF6321 domain-containing protein n=1 Tax=Cyanophage S-RIM50 TaxID=687803 RepID=A0A127KLL6_9CAUD|nr:hypothetical protein BJD43_gp140 [Cyanophage S-RIM50]AMO42890.1 hypothetical protein R290704_108 [Cyanophage S-RIM50]